MNKAFIREPEETGHCRCPKCSSQGIPVGAETWRAHLAPQWHKHLAPDAYYCEFPRCEVGYFDAFERFVPALELQTRIFPKFADSALCACFGFTRDEVEQDVREGGVRRVKELLERCKSAEARCQVASPSGTCCQAQVQRYFLKFREDWKASQT